MNKYKSLNAEEFESMLALGFAALKNKEEEINRLNVFPVPDGDTGGNMRMTYESGLSAIKSGAAHTVGEAAALFARGTLLGARGNSGVILSQIFKGIALGLDGKSVCAVADLCAAFSLGVEKSYKAVVKPVEGTMLTVFREATESVAGCKDIGFDSLFKKFNAALEKSLEETPELLPVLKKAGVIDSGGAGLKCIFGGFARFFGGEKIDYVSVSAYQDEIAAASQEEEEFGYCTEFLLNLSDTAKCNFDINQLISRLESIGGESIVALRDGDIVKVHVHVLTPGDALNIAQQYGEFMTVKIENMTVQHSELKKAAAPLKERIKTALIAVASDGFTDIFYSMGADFVVGGGQSMNPSVEDFISAFNAVNADDIIVLPDNSNVVLTANQAGDMYRGSRVHVLETKSLSQGYSALSLYNPDSPVEEIISDLTAAKDSVISMELTRAIRDAEVDGLSVKKDDCIAITDGKMAGAGKDYLSALSSALAKIDLSGKCAVTVFGGEGAGDDGIVSFFAEKHPDIEVSCVQTNQKIYAYIIAIE